MRKLYFLTTLCLLMAAFSFAQPKANYALAAKFSPKKLDKLVYSLQVDPHWLKKSDRFWYVYETPAGKRWMIVDPAKNSKQELFDAAKLASQITTLVKDPFDAQHLGLENLKFIKDETSLQFEVKSTLEIEKRDSTKKPVAVTKEKKTFYFEYELATGKLTELTDYKKPKVRPNWASISPDRKWVVFAKKYNLYLMDSANYAKAQVKEEDSTIVETQLTTDGVENYGYGGDSYGESNEEKEKNKNKRKSAFLLWSPDSKYFALTKTDARKVKDLWVLNNVAEGRPTLETYKYHMPGEPEAPQKELLLFDMVKRSMKPIPSTLFKDQELAISSKPYKQVERDDDFRSVQWAGTADRFYVTRTSRDLKKIDICAVDVKTGSFKVLIEERLNTYVETRRLGLVNDGKELIEWSERDGWGHFYLYDGEGQFKNAIG